MGAPKRGVLWLALLLVLGVGVLHSTPTRSPPNAISEEMSSDFTAGTGSAKAVPQLASLQAGLQSDLFTHTLPPCTQVAHSWPLESLSITSVSVLKLLISTGNPASRVYVFVAAS